MTVPGTELQRVLASLLMARFTWHTVEKHTQATACTPLTQKLWNFINTCHGLFLQIQLLGPLLLSRGLEKLAKLGSLLPT